jgi:hypothetical protein
MTCPAEELQQLDAIGTGGTLNKVFLVYFLPVLALRCQKTNHSHSIVAGGLPEIS